MCIFDAIVRADNTITYFPQSTQLSSGHFHIIQNRHGDERRTQVLAAIQLRFARATLREDVFFPSQMRRELIVHSRHDADQKQIFSFAVCENVISVRIVFHNCLSPQKRCGNVKYAGVSRRFLSTTAALSCIRNSDSRDLHPHDRRNNESIHATNGFDSLLFSSHIFCLIGRENVLPLLCRLPVTLQPEWERIENLHVCGTLASSFESDAHLIDAFKFAFTTYVLCMLATSDTTLLLPIRSMACLQFAALSSTILRSVGRTRTAYSYSHQSFNVHRVSILGHGMQSISPSEAKQNEKSSQSPASFRFRKQLIFSFHFVPLDCRHKSLRI